MTKQLCLYSGLYLDVPSALLQLQFAYHALHGKDKKEDLSWQDTHNQMLEDFLLEKGNSKTTIPIISKVIPKERSINRPYIWLIEQADSKLIKILFSMPLPPTVLVWISSWSSKLPRFWLWLSPTFRANNNALAHLLCYLFGHLVNISATVLILMVGTIHQLEQIGTFLKSSLAWEYLGSFNFLMMLKNIGLSGYSKRKTLLVNLSTQASLTTNLPV